MTSYPDAKDHPARILIVDDERQDRQLLEVLLAPLGHLIQMASSGEEALALVAHEPPDLILLDIMMPGMDGYEVTARIKADPVTLNIPIIMITALDDRDARMRALGSGAEDILSKPVDRLELGVRVRNLLRLKAYSDYHDRYSQLLEDEVETRTADLVTSEARKGAILESALDCVVATDAEGIITEFNRAAEKTFGYLR
jgi:CheY-like chemotaxis protein